MFTPHKKWIKMNISTKIIYNAHKNTKDNKHEYFHTMYKGEGKAYYL